MDEIYCFVLMPFGRKKDAEGREVNFDAVYTQIISPAITSSGLTPIRADQELAGGIIHKPMFERLILCDYAVADLTAWNANVMYELGVRHAVRPWRTVAMFARGTSLPFDVQMLRACPYELDRGGVPGAPEADRENVKQLLEAARRDADDPPTDSPVFQLVDFWPRACLDHARTHLFRDRVRYSQAVTDRLLEVRAAARQPGATQAVSVAAVEAVEAGLKRLSDLEPSLVVELLLSYRDVGAWDQMVRLVERMPATLRETILVQEQYAFALNRRNNAARGDRDRAVRTLDALIAKHGPRAETFGILGRVYKDRFRDARATGDGVRARGLLQKAIETYVRGFEADWRNPYPGLNALALMQACDPPDARTGELLPVVEYAASRGLRSAMPGYWEHAAMLEVAVLKRDAVAANAAMENAVATEPPAWMLQSTAENLRLVREARELRGEHLPWAAQLELALRGPGGPPGGPGSSNTP